MARWGEMAWPGVLQREIFDEERAEIENVMNHLAANNSGYGSPSHLQVQEVVQRLTGKLKENMDQVSGSESIAARKYLHSLVYEMRFPLQDSKALLSAK